MCAEPGATLNFPPQLIEGYQNFQRTRLPLERRRFQNLAEAGQRPDVMVIGCCDSRVSPEVIFDTHPGELFVVRNVANLVPPYSPTGLTHGVSAALEFAVVNLEVRHIIVMGHSHCGGVRAFVEHRDQPSSGDFIDRWMTLIAPAASALDAQTNLTTPDYLARLEQASTVATLGNLMTFPWIRSRVVTGQLQLLAVYFDVATGLLTVHDRDIGSFREVV